jgi:hypothetical protein
VKMSPDLDQGNDANIGSSGDRVVVSKADRLRNSALLLLRVSAREAWCLPGGEKTSRLESVSENREVQLVVRNSTTEVEWS